MNAIITKVRDLIGDSYKYTTDIFVYRTSKIFTLSESNVDSTSLVAYKNEVSFPAITATIPPVTNWTYSLTTGKITVITALVAGNILEYSYNACKKYSDNELRGYIRASLTYLATEKYGVFVGRSDNEVFPTPTEAEENLIALIACILTRGNISDYRTPEINISFNEKETMEEKITRAIRQFKKTFGTVKYIKPDRDISIDKEDE